MAAIFCEKIFFENWHGYSAEIPFRDMWVEKKIQNSSKSLYLAQFSRYKHFYVLQFLRKIRKFKMAAIFGETKIFFKNWDIYSTEIPCGSKILSKSLYQAFLCFAIFAKNSKIQNGRHFWRDKIFLKTGITTPQRYPVGQKFRRNRSI